MNKSEKFWDKIARKYSKSEVKDKEGYEKTLDDTRRFLKRNASILEIGCGTGSTALKLSGSVNKMTASDLSSNMIAIAKEKAEKLKIKNVNFVHSTLFDKNLKKKSFDVIIAFNLIHLLDDVEAAMKRIMELLRPGGLFISKTPCLKENKLLPLIVFVISKVKGIGRIHSFTIAELKKLMTNEGFEIIDSHIYPGSAPKLFAVARKGK